MVVIGYVCFIGKIGVCIVIFGSGVINLIIGLVDVLLDLVFVVVIMGQVFVLFIGIDVFQEVDVLGLLLVCIKYSFLVQLLEELLCIMVEVFEVVNVGCSGLVLVDILKDIQLVSGELEFWFIIVVNEVIFLQVDVEQVCQMLEQVKKFMLYVGGGVGMVQVVLVLCKFIVVM